MVDDVPPQGWAELLEWMQERSTVGQLDSELAWRSFRALAVASQYAGLPELVVRFGAARAEDRLALVGTIASILAPVEWPEAWDGPRQRFVSAIEELLREIRLDAPDVIAGVLELGADRDLFELGRSQLTMAQELLRAPCRRDELRTAGRLCEGGTLWTWRAVVRALERPERRAPTAMVVAARHRYAVALGVYGEAAQALNDACGSVVVAVAHFTFPNAT